MKKDGRTAAAEGQRQGREAVAGWHASGNGTAWQRWASRRAEQERAGGKRSQTTATARRGASGVMQHDLSPPAANIGRHASSRATVEGSRLSSTPCLKLARRSSRASDFLCKRCG